MATINEMRAPQGHSFASPLFQLPPAYLMSYLEETKDVFVPEPGDVVFLNLDAVGSVQHLQSEACLEAMDAVETEHYAAFVALVSTTIPIVESWTHREVRHRY